MELIADKRRRKRCWTEIIAYTILPIRLLTIEAIAEGGTSHETYSDTVDCRARPPGDLFHPTQHRRGPGSMQACTRLPDQPHPWTIYRKRRTRNTLRH